MHGDGRAGDHAAALDPIAAVRAALRQCAHSGFALHPGTSVRRRHGMPVRLSTRRRASPPYAHMVGLYDDVYAAFAEADVPYVIVGGMAVVLSGHVRATVDLDVIVDLNPEPALRAMQALQRLGLLPRVPIDPADFADPTIRDDWIRNKHMQVLSFFDPQHVAREVDVFVAHPIDFDALSAAAVHMDVGGHTVPVASLPHLIDLKRAAGRPRDLEDIKALQVLLEAEHDRGR